MVLKSTYQGSLTFDAAPLVIDEISVIGSRCGPFEPALKLLREKRIPVQQLITEVYSFHQVEEAFQRAAQPVRGLPVARRHLRSARRRNTPGQFKAV